MQRALKQPPDIIIQDKYEYLLKNERKKSRLTLKAHNIALKFQLFIQNSPDLCWVGELRRSAVVHLNAIIFKASQFEFFISAFEGLYNMLWVRKSL